MAITKNKEQIHINGGDNFKINPGSGYITLGHIISGKLTRSVDKQEVVFADGSSTEFEGKTKCSIQIVLAQVTKEILDKLDELRGIPCQAFFYNGLSDKYMEIYAPEARITSPIDLDMKGQAHQTIAIELSIAPQTSNASCHTKNDLPADAYAYADPGATVTGKNAYYVILETTPA